MAKGYGQGTSPRFKSGAGMPPGKFKTKNLNAVGPGGKLGQTMKGQTRISGVGPRIGGFGKKGFNRADTPGTIG